MKLTLSKNNLTTMCLALLAAYAVLLLPSGALAASVSSTASGLESVLCSIVNWFTGPIGAGIATIAIIVIGVGAMMGKVSWGMAIIVALGVGVVFGAKTIVTALSPGNNPNFCP